MKNILLSLATCAVLITSCTAPMSITKRHYNSGYYVESSTPARHAAKQEQSVSEPKQKISVLTPVSQKEENAVLVNSTATASAASKIEKHQTSVNYKAVNAPLPFKKSPAPAPVIKKEKTSNNILVHKSLKTTSSSDVNIILLIILCLLLPPVAILLKENGLTWRFWVDLLLCLLFFLPGVIFAFIVCFA